jgi:tetratricopeptide (TPR) repeat protein
MGYLERTHGHYREAQQHYEQSLKLNTVLGRSTAVVQAFLGLAEVALSMEQVEAATTYVHHAIELAHSLENAHLIINALETQARIFIERNNPEAAVTYLTFTTAYPRYTSLDEKRRNALLNTMRTRMTPAAYEAAVERGHNQLLHDLISAVLG